MRWCDHWLLCNRSLKSSIIGFSWPNVSVHRLGSMSLHKKVASNEVFGLCHGYCLSRSTLACVECVRLYSLSKGKRSIPLNTAFIIHEQWSQRKLNSEKMIKLMMILLTCNKTDWHLPVASVKGTFGYRMALIKSNRNNWAKRVLHSLGWNNKVSYLLSFFGCCHNRREQTQQTVDGRKNCRLAAIHIN